MARKKITRVGKDPLDSGIDVPDDYDPTPKEAAGYQWQSTVGANGNPAPRRSDDNEAVYHVDTSSDPVHTQVGDDMVTQHPEGAVVSLGGALSQTKTDPGNNDADDFYKNLAEDMDEGDLAKIAEDLLDKIDADIESGRPWSGRLERGLELMGLQDVPSANLPFDNAAAVTHPLIAEAVVQFNARSIKELVPPGGGAKTYVEGKETDELRESAEKVEDHLNYQMTVEDAGYFDEMDRMLFYLPMAGTAFDMTYRDTVRNRTLTRFIKGEDVILPYACSSMHDAPRITMRDRISHNELLKRQYRGEYRDIKIDAPVIDEADATALQGEIDEADERVVAYADGDYRHTIYNSFTDLSLPGYEHTDDRGKETGIGQPYIVKIDKESRKIVAIVRNWSNEDDSDEFCAEQYFTMHKMFPGLGVYGYGYLHFLGGLASTVSSVMRALLDSAAFASLQGGFCSKDAKLAGGDIELRPGEYIPTALTAEELSKAFYTPPFKEPSQALFNLMGTMIDSAQRFMSTTDNVVGDANNTGPVGTTVALIEQGTKVMSGVHQRLHRSFQSQYAIRARINKQYMPEDGDYFYVGGQKHEISADDYDDTVMIVPISDPNIVSQTQRIAQAQAIQQLSTQKPQLYDQYKVERIMVEAVASSSIADDILIKPDDAPYTDPLSEGSLMMAGKQIRAYYQQDHESHLAVHQIELKYLMTLDPQMSKPLLFSLNEHIAKHTAYAMYVKMNQAAGGQWPPIDLYQTGTEHADMPPQIERMVSEQMAQSLPQIAQMVQQMEQASQPNPAAEIDAASQAKIKAMGNESDAKIQIMQNEAKAKTVADGVTSQLEENRKKQQFVNDESRKTEALSNDANRKDGMMYQAATHKEVAKKQEIRHKAKTQKQKENHAARDQGKKMAHADLNQQQKQEQADAAHEQQLEQAAELAAAQQSAAVDQPAAGSDGAGEPSSEPQA